MLVTIQEVGKITTKTQRLEYPYSQQSINAHAIQAYMRKTFQR